MEQFFMIKQIIPATDWFFIVPAADDKKKQIIPLFVWALYGDGTVIGMTSFPLYTPKKIPFHNRLVDVPIMGEYKHWYALSDSERSEVISLLHPSSEESPDKAEHVPETTWGIPPMCGKPPEKKE